SADEEAPSQTGHAARRRERADGLFARKTACRRHAGEIAQDRSRSRAVVRRQPERAQQPLAEGAWGHEAGRRALGLVSEEKLRYPERPRDGRVGCAERLRLESGGHDRPRRHLVVRPLQALAWTRGGAPQTAGRE